MFDKHKPAPEPSAPGGAAVGGKTAAPTKPVAAAVDYVIHSLPKEFYDRTAKLPESAQVVSPGTPKPPAQLPSMAPLLATAPGQPRPGVLLPMNRANRGPLVVKPKVVAPPPPKKTKKVLIVILALVLMAGAALVILAISLGWFTPEPPVTTPPEPQVTTPTPTPTVTPPTPEPPKPVSGADTDSDGLTNVEEILYTTDFRNPDSDGDTFLDGNEVFHRYSPVGLAPATLLDIGAVRVLETVDIPFSLSYPTSWNPVTQPAAKSVSFRSSTGAAVSVVWQDKSTVTSLSDWYAANVVAEDFDSLQSTTTKEGYSALIGPDERVMYLDGGANVYTLKYELGDSQSVEFLQTFKMMANSFKLSP